jgi:hypothetical protein
MKVAIAESIKSVLSDRLLTALLVGLLLVCIGYCLFVGLSLRPSDLQVAIHYTAYGETNFYREKWYYLISFILFGLVVAVVHTTLTVKLYLQGRRQIALLFIGLSFLVMVIASFFAWSVLRIAFL